MIKKIMLNDETLSLIERLDYETLSKSNTIATLIESSPNKDILESKIFKKYNDEYIRKFAEYELAKIAVGDIILDELNNAQVTANWTLDFAAGEITVTAEAYTDAGIKKVEYIDIEEEELEKLQNLFFSVSAMRAIVIKIFDRHKLDSDTTVIDSEVFNEFQANLAVTEKEYELEKTRMINKFLSAELQTCSLKWGFDFFHNRLEVNLMDNRGVELFEKR